MGFSGRNFSLGGMMVEPLSDEDLELIRGGLHHIPSKEWDWRFIDTIDQLKKENKIYADLAEEQSITIDADRERIAELQSVIEAGMEEASQRIQELEAENLKLVAAIKAADPNFYGAKEGVNSIIAEANRLLSDKVVSLKTENERLKTALYKITSRRPRMKYAVESVAVVMAQIAIQALRPQEEDACGK